MKGKENYDEKKNMIHEKFSLTNRLFFLFLLKLRREQELQQQKLWRDFQEQKKELELQHKMQIETKLQVSCKYVIVTASLLLNSCLFC